MAKALLGHVVRPDPRMAAQVRRLQQRVAELESQVMRLQAANDALAAAAGSEELLTIPAEHQEPALA
ncbi:MAG: hypothetical protein ACYCXA_05060 [Actinomycetes bacterium]